MDMQMARRAVDTIDGTLLPIRFVLHGRDSKFCASFQDTLRSAGIQPLRLPARSPNLNAFAERWVRSIKSEYLSKLILLGEASLRRAVTEFIEDCRLERPHQGKGNQLLFPSPCFPTSTRWSNPASRSPRRSAQVLSTRRMIILTLRDRQPSPL
jgi:transposase InsO family protein